MMTLRRSLTALFALTLTILPGTVHAAELYIYCSNLPGCGSGFTQYFGSVLNLLLTLLPPYIYAIGGLFIMIGGARIVMSAGNSEGVTKGKNTILWALGGIFLTEFAVAFVGFIKDEVNSRVAEPDLVLSVVSTLKTTIFDLFYLGMIAIAIYSGMRMVLSAGKEEEFNKGRDGLFYAGVGALVINVAQIMVNAFSTL